MIQAEPWQWGVVALGFALVYLFIGPGKGWLMRAIQITIVMATAATNIYWPWTPSPILPGLLGVGLAWIATVFPLKVRLWWQRRPLVKDERRAVRAMAPEEREHYLMLKSMDRYERTAYELTPQDRASYFKLAEMSPKTRQEYIHSDLATYEEVRLVELMGDRPAIKREWYFKTLPENLRAHLLWGSPH